MAISLIKGESIPLTKEHRGLDNIKFCASWDINPEAKEEAFDIDINAFALGKDGKVSTDDDFVFYNQKKHPSGAIVLNKDNLTGEGEGVDEEIEVTLSRIPESIEEIIFTTTIYTQQSFGDIQSSSVYIINASTDMELARYDLGEEFAADRAVITGKLYRYQGEWKFKAVGQGVASGLEGLCALYDVKVI